MSRRPLVVANWKMNHTRRAARHWCAALGERLEAEPWPSGVEVAVAPPFTALAAVAESAERLGLALAAQNCHSEPSGPVTGEVSAPMLEEAGCRYVIVGHSERRQQFGETDRFIARKVAAARRAGLVPILCIGESENQRESQRTEPVLEAQLRQGLSEVRLGSGDELVVAYEPVWAIGTGRVATPELAGATQAFVRDILAAVAGPAVAEATRILYGGSVKPESAAGLFAQPHVDGFLVGGASLEAEPFHRIVLACGSGSC
ncbi:MAG: triose-phosphate isomerase [Acidobacteria bacterium]|nr:MAG: triose-phosphate isomerase [Acidobacteriota bacterium]